jgi:predicted PhzF superfamily epimerase YddE/YHI9
VIITAPGDGDYDIVSRYFAPGAASTDPVTGAAHCTLAPYWGDRLGLRELLAHQASPRGGELRLTLDDRGGPPRIGGCRWPGEPCRLVRT